MIVVRAVWDPEAAVFVATSEDVPGLVAESATLEELDSKLRVLIPELMELNASPNGLDDIELQDVPLMVIAEQLSKVRVRAHG